MKRKMTYHNYYVRSLVLILLLPLCLFFFFVRNYSKNDAADDASEDPTFNNRGEEQQSSSMKYERTTCSQKAYMRGFGQKVIAFTYFKGKAEQNEVRHYVQGIQGNLEVIGQLYGQNWTMRLYHNLDPKELEVIKFAGNSDFANQLELCNVNQNPMFGNASVLFPTLWRFLPILDDQVEVAMFRDLDSRPSQREVDAVHEWLQSKHAFHVMRDHPGHDLPMLAGMWGLKLTGAPLAGGRSSSSDDNNLRPILRRIFLAILRHTSAYWEYWDPQTDQMILRRFFWPWAKTIMLQHDSFHCDLFAKSRSWPSQRPEGQLDNFVGSPVSLNATLTDECPLRCRPREHPEWKQC